MTTAELLPRLEKAGIRLMLVGPDSMEAEIPDPAPPGINFLLNEVREHRGEFIAALSLRSSFPCIDCRTPLAEGVLLCPTCLKDRAARRKVLPFDPDRRRRTEARLAAARCSSCSGSWWGVDERGDAWCESCRRRIVLDEEVYS